MGEQECGKRCYSSRHGAKLAHRRAGFRVNIYWCHGCRAWHACATDKKPNRSHGRRDGQSA